MITSRQNAWFQRVRDAIRSHAAEIVIEGPKAAADAMAGGWNALAVIERAPDGPDHGRAADGQRRTDNARRSPDVSTLPGSSAAVPVFSNLPGGGTAAAAPRLVFSAPLFDQLS